jgi:hypothetical protein
MKIIAHTHNGYLLECDKEEMEKLTGERESRHDYSKRHGTGGVIRVLPLCDHISAMEKTIQQRKDVAETLRAAATIIETTQAVFTEQ